MASPDAVRKLALLLPETLEQPILKGTLQPWFESPRNKAWAKHNLNSIEVSLGHIIQMRLLPHLPLFLLPSSTSALPCAHAPLAGFTDRHRGFAFTLAMVTRQTYCAGLLYFSCAFAVHHLSSVLMSKSLT